MAYYLCLAAGGTAGILLATGLIYQALGSARDRRRFPPPGRLVDIHNGDGGRLHLHGMGESGPSVILDAGIGASSLSWSLVQPLVARFARVYAYDRAGYGWSEPPQIEDGRRIASRMAEELRKLLRAAEVPGPYILVGHSFGGYVARVYAERWPVEVAGLVMLDSPSASDWAHPSPERRRQHQGGALFSRIGGTLARFGVVRYCLNRFSRGSRGLPVAITRAFGSGALDLVTRMVGQVLKYPPGLRAVAQAHWSRPAPFFALADHLEYLPESAREVAACGSLGELPFVVMTQSNPTPERAAQQDALACQSTRGRHIIAREGGHWLMLDQPELVVGAIAWVVGAAAGRNPAAKGTAGH
ncbi:MAG TPA: alpha/beta hydrolase [Candidatus Acidoferrales bacterium]|nr:alpha/beta hydrolase [Candidatus Acidoferrales bacterium]